MKRIFFPFLAALLFAACKKDNNETSHPLPPSRLELLTNSPWKLVNYGFDDDSTGQLEPHEYMGKQCEKDNTVLFRKNGTGTTYDNGDVCLPNPENNFTWSFAEQDTMLNFGLQEMRIRTLSEKSMILSDDEFFTTSFIAVYSR